MESFHFTPPLVSLLSLLSLTPLLTGENMDALEANQLTLPGSEEQLTTLQPGVAGLEEPVPGPALGEQTLMIKVEPRMEDYKAPSPFGTSDGAATSKLSGLWAVGGEAGADASEHKRQAADKHQGGTSPRRNLPFAENKPSGELVPSDQLLMGMPSELTLAPEVQDHAVKQEVAVHEFAISNQRPDEYEMNVMESGDQEGGGEQDFSGHNCFICSSCGQSFESFSLFQMHPCNSLT